MTRKFELFGRRGCWKKGNTSPIGWGSWWFGGKINSWNFFRLFGGRSRLGWSASGEGWFGGWTVWKFGRWPGGRFIGRSSGWFGGGGVGRI